MRNALAKLSVDMEGLNVLNKKRYERVLWERRLMFFSTTICILCIILFSIAVSTTSWAIFDVFDEKLNVTVQLFLGIWGEWRIEKEFDTGQFRKMTWIRHFPEPPPETTRLTDADLLHYHRTQAVFSVIALVLMGLGNGFALYSFKHHRYMYKRLVFGLFAFVAMCILVVIEVLINSVNEWKSFTHYEQPIHPPHPHQYQHQLPPPSQSENAAGNGNGNENTDEKREHHPADYYFRGMSYGYSTYLSWIVFVIYCLAAIIFLIGGRKQKGSRAATVEFEEEDRPYNLS